MGQSNKNTIKFRIFPGFQLLGSNLTKLTEICGNEGLEEKCCVLNNNFGKFILRDFAKLNWRQADFNLLTVIYVTHFTQNYTGFFWCDCVP